MIVLISAICVMTFAIPIAVALALHHREIKKHTELQKAHEERILRLLKESAECGYTIMKNTEDNNRR